MDAKLKSGYPRVWYICKYCFRAFTNNDDMVSHKETQHPNQLKGDQEEIVTSESDAEDVQDEVQGSSSSGREKRTRRGLKKEIPRQGKSLRTLTTSGRKQKDKQITTSESDSEDVQQGAAGLSSSGRGKRLKKRVVMEIPRRDKSRRTSTTSEKSKATFKDYYCEECDEHFISLYSLKKHQSNIHPDTETDSDELSKSDSKSSSDSESKDPTVKIKFTPDRRKDSPFAGRQILKGHQNTVQQKPKRTFDFRCLECNEHFVSLYRLKKHQSNNHAETDEMSNASSESHDNELEATKKLKYKNQDSLPNNLINKNATPIRCVKCNIEFATLQILKGHQSTVHRKPVGFPCEECNQEFRTLYFLRKHTNNVHNNTNWSDDERSEPKEVFTIKVQPRRNSVHNSSEKSRTHRKAKEKLFACNECREDFYTFDGLIKHKNFAHDSTNATIVDSESDCSLYEDFSNIQTPKPETQISAKTKNVSVLKTNDSANKCSYCLATFDRLDILEYHINQIHHKVKFRSAADTWWTRPSDFNRQDKVPVEN